MGAVAQRFYQAYDGEPLPVDAANEALASLRRMVADARSALNATAKEQLTLLDRLAGLELVQRRIYLTQ
jgi:hypothetical protein